MDLARKLGYNRDDQRQFVRGYLHAAEESVKKEELTVEQIIERCMKLYIGKIGI